jgi:hypothetical protein
MGRLINGALHFHPCSVDSRSEKGRCIRKGYAGEADLFGVYCRELQKCYLVPVEDVPTTACCLRIDPPRNGQRNGIRWADGYEIRPEPVVLQELELST